MTNEMLVLGILASLLFYEITEISPGGIIVPGYMALFLDNPKRILATVVLSLLTYAVVRLLSGYTILFGKRKFALYIIVSFLIRYSISVLAGKSGIPLSADLVVGYLVPGILAQETDRQGIFKTYAAMFIVAFVLKIGLLAYFNLYHHFC